MFPRVNLACTCLCLLAMLVTVDAFVFPPTLPSLLRRGAAGVAEGSVGLETATKSLKNICRQSLVRGRGLAMTSDPSESPKARDSCPAIIVGDIHMIAPGERRIVHMYDRENLKALKKAKGGDHLITFVMLDPVALESRKFALAEVGVQCKVLSVEKTTKLAKNVDGFEGGQSSSRLVEVVGLHRLKVGANAVQRSPYIVARISPFEGVGAAADSPGVDTIVELFGQLLDLKRGMGIDGGDSWEKSVEERLEAVAELGADAKASTEERVALAAASLLDGADKVKALAIQDPVELISFVEASLKESTQRLLAVKALKGLNIK